MIRRTKYLLLCLLGCGALDDRSLPPRGQIRLLVDTDAIVPRAPGAPPDAAQPAPVFDRLRIEVFPPGEVLPCVDCTREFPIDERAFRERRVSAGVVPRPDASGYRARVVLYRGFGVDSSGARQASSLDTYVALPVVGDEGVVDVTVVLETANVGKVLGSLDAPDDVRVGPPEESRVGTFARDLRRPCAGEARAGEVCVPGAAYWMGDLTLPDFPERLVAVSPFFVDAYEVTVAAMRSSGLASAAIGRGDLVAAAPGSHCTYTAAPGALEDRPVDCLTRALAEQYCELGGKRLPTEAEFAFVASGRVGDPFVWGGEEPACADAVFARNGPTAAETDRYCAALGEGPQRGGQGKKDVLALPGGAVFDLAGNMVEWTIDDYVTKGDCHDAPIAFDPRCVVPGAPPAFRGGGWITVGAYLRASNRGAGDFPTPNAGIGFRCVRPG